MKITPSSRSIFQPMSLCAAMLASAACGADTQRGAPVPPPAQPITAEGLGSEEAAAGDSAAEAAADTETEPLSFAGLPLQESPASWQDAQAFAASRAACAGSRGAWDPALLSCTCVAGELFTLGAGCGPIEPPRGGRDCAGPLAQMKGEQQAACARSLTLETLLLNLDLSAYKPAQVKTLARGLDTVSPVPLAGITLPAAGSGQQLTLSNRLPAILPGIADKWASTDGFPQATHTTSPWEPLAKAGNATKACVAALTPHSADAKALCGALARARGGLANDAKMRWRLQVFGDDAGHQILFGHANVAKLPVFYLAHVQQGLPLQRQLDIADASGGHLQVLLSANGSIAASTWFGPQSARAAFTTAWAPI